MEGLSGQTERSRRRASAVGTSILVERPRWRSWNIEWTERSDRAVKQASAYGAIQQPGRASEVAKLESTGINARAGGVFFYLVPGAVWCAASTRWLIGRWWWFSTPR